MERDKLLIIQFFIFLYSYAFIPKSIFMMLFLGEIALFSVVALRNKADLTSIVKLEAQVHTLPVIFGSFLLISVLYLVLSYFDILKFWGIDNLWFEKSYIPRHFIIVPELLLAVGVGYVLAKTDLVFELKNKHLLLFFIVTYSIRFFRGQLGRMPYSEIMVASLVLLVFRTNKKWFLLFVPFINMEQSAYMLGSLLLILLVMARDSIVRLFSGNTTSKVYIMLVLLGIVITIFSDALYEYIYKDENALWRLYVWSDEIKTLLKTDLLGVGFGSAYVTSDILSVINNDHMYITTDAMNIYERVFVVANHNTFLNMFYRMGVVGGLLFLTLFVMMIRWALETYRLAPDWLKEYIWCAFVCFMYQAVVILLNPGLEMMQFAINFITSLAILIGMLMRANQEIYINPNEEYND